MNPRQRFRETLLFGKPDKIPFNPGHPRESTLEAWHKQGLPEDRYYMDELFEILGIPQEPAREEVDLGVSFIMMPVFEEKVIEHKNGHYIVQDWMGAITEISDTYDYTYIRTAKDFVTRKWHSFPVKTKADWEEKIKWRYNPAEAGRFPEDFEDRCKRLKERDYVKRLNLNGPFWQLREWCGMEGLCYLMVEQPEFVQEMVDFWSDFVLTTMEPILERVELDFVQFNEDMAYKLHSMISPKMARKFLLPIWKKWTDEIKASGCPIVSIDSDGYMAELIPLWIEAGVNSCFPAEVAAGNDIVEFRKQYGTKMAFEGGIDKRAIAAGGEIMRSELLRVIPPLLESGGFIPGCDHGVPPDISWQNFIEYSRLLAQLTGWL